MMEEVGFEPTVGDRPTSVFKTDAFGHSATLPDQKQIDVQVIKDYRTKCQPVFGYF